MNRSITIVLSLHGLCAALLFVFSLPVSGQTSPEIEALARRTAERIAKTHQQHIFVASLQECQLDRDICALFESSLGANLEKAAPSVHIVKREGVINILEGRGFLALDAYNSDVLKAVAPSAGADLLVTETLQWESDGYELISELFNTLQRKRLEQFRAKIARALPDSSGEPLMFTDPESGVSLMIPRGKQSRHPLAGYASCVRCPDAVFTPEARANRLEGRVLLLLTVTEQGIAEHIGIISGLDYGLTEQALEAVRNWQFKPATGLDGKPISTRVPIEVTFRLQ